MNKTPTVGLISHKRKSGISYRLRYKIPGQKNYTYEYLGIISRQNARLECAQRQTELKQGTYNRNIYFNDPIPLEQLLNEFYIIKSNLRKPSLKRYKSYTNRFSDFFKQNFPTVHSDIRNIKSIYIAEFLQKVRDKKFISNPWNLKTANDARGVLSSLFKYAVKQKYISDNPLSEIPPFSIPEKSKGKEISSKDLRRILEKLPNHWKDVFKILLYTGLRNSELINLRWSNFHKFPKKKGYYIEIISSEDFITKTGKKRMIPLKSKAEDIILSIPKNKSEYIFTTSYGKKISDHRLRKVLIKVCEELKLSYRVHDFRHTFGSRLANQNISLYIISELMGHSIEDTTKLYAHLQAEDLKEAVELIEI